ncbi:hypothetical protein LTR95_009986 [Oleoguttula sp. CCFEE 5521]
MAEDRLQPAKPLRMEWKTTFKVEVGVAPDNFTYTLYTDFFTRRSPFFNAATSNTWSNGKTLVDLTDYTTDIFDAYLHFVYTKEISLKQPRSGLDGNDGSQADTDETAGQQLAPLIRMYVLADKLGDLSTANSVMDELILQSDEDKMIVSTGCANDIYEHAAQGSPLRKLVLDWYVHDAGPIVDSAGLSQEVLEAIFQEYTTLRYQDYEAKGRGVKNGFHASVSHMVASDKCRYHPHDNDHPRCT